MRSELCLDQADSILLEGSSLVGLNVAFGLSCEKFLHASELHAGIRVGMHARGSMRTYTSCRQLSETRRGAYLTSKAVHVR